MNSIRNFFSSRLQNNGSGGFMGNLSNLSDMMQKFQRFANNPIGEIMGMGNVNVPQNFNGNPRDLVNFLISSGQMSNEQYQQFEQMANQMQGMFNR